MTPKTVSDDEEKPGNSSTIRRVGEGVVWAHVYDGVVSPSECVEGWCLSSYTVTYGVDDSVSWTTRDVAVCSYVLCLVLSLFPADTVYRP